MAVNLLEISPDYIGNGVADESALKDDLGFFVGLADDGALGEGRLHAGLGGEGGFVAWKKRRGKIMRAQCYDHQFLFKS
jgi:hypothetical protein